ncbi:MAG TPA: DUF2794 domain-containing protein [Rhizomicrobium sp.]|jgi:hypothetical protein
MAEEPIAFLRAEQRSAARTGQWSGGGFTAAQVRYDRRELNQILNIYGRMVAAGEWRDYALDFGDDAAVFSIFRRTSEMPLYRVEKRPALRSKQGMFAVIDAGGRILKRGHELENVLRVFAGKLLKALSSD